MAIKCHSGFVHYNMFHNNHCHGGGNNYGSIFNITHNCGGGTNFWGGLGAGLGFGLGGMFSGLFGNFMGGFGNMFGGFGMGNMFGGLGNMFGGFGMGGFGSPFGSGWGSGINGLFGNKNKTDNSETRTKTSSDDTKSLTDKDYSKINDLHAKANEYIGKEATEENLKEVNALLEEVGKFDLEDENLSPENKEQLKNIKTQLEAKQQEINTALANKPIAPDASSQAAQAAQAAQAQAAVTPAVTEEVTEDEDVDASEEAEDIEETPDATPDKTPVATKTETQEKIEKATTAQDLVAALGNKTWNDLTKAEREALAANPLVKNIENLDDESREKIQKIFYNGRTNYVSGQPITSVKRAIDTKGEVVGTPRKIEGEYTNGDTTQLNPTAVPKKFSLTDTFINSNNEFTVNYTLKEVRPPMVNKTGEIVYVSDNGQEYALQLNKKGEYELVQYPWHKGYGTPDKTQA